ncbi:DUF3429 domain-containing protein [Sinimarinibacterium thermocellulolyticum]|uniref:DUF3429 domain-containing protein n=1 Tax=Sinimarinibacterium thermocellulolyticum TaxID=3170016 RepID=A0ABV2ADA5_9GAMM
MKLPRLVSLLGYAGLIPFFAGPLWLSLSPATVPHWLDHAWLVWVGMIAAFMAGTFWGFALPAAEGPAGTMGLLFSMALMLAAWTAMTLARPAALTGLILVFLLLLLADFWRERTLGAVEGYFGLRTALTVGACLAIAWRLAL